MREISTIGMSPVAQYSSNWATHWATAKGRPVFFTTLKNSLKFMYVFHTG